MKKFLLNCNVRFFLQTKYQICNCFMLKDKILSFLHSGIIWNFQSAGCLLSIMAKLNFIFKVRIWKHFGISALAGKRVKTDDDSAMKKHLLFFNHATDFEDFSILTTNNNDFKVTLMESLLINRDHFL